MGRTPNETTPTTTETPTAPAAGNDTPPAPTPPAAPPAEPGHALIGDGEASTFTVKHDLGTDKVDVVVRKKLTGQPVNVDAEPKGKDAVVVDFGDAVPGPDTFEVEVRKAG